MTAGDKQRPLDPALVAHCDRVRAAGLTDEALFRLLDDMASALTRVRAWPVETRRHRGIPEEWLT